MEDLRKELGTFSNEDVDVSEFPNIAKLVEDFENADSSKQPDNLENLRKELNQFAETEESKDINFDVIDKLIELETDQGVLSSESLDTDISEHLTKQQIDDLYENVSDLTFTSDLNGVNEENIVSSAYTLQFGTLVMKNKNHLQMV